MNDKCPFKDKGYCDIWIDYIVIKDEYSECNKLLHLNWKEITRLYERIDVLEQYIESIGGKIPQL